MEPLDDKNAWIGSVRASRHRMRSPLLFVIALLVLGIALVGGPRLFSLWQGLYGGPGREPSALAEAVYDVFLLWPLYAGAGLALCAQ